MLKIKKDSTYLLGRKKIRDILIWTFIGILLTGTLFLNMHQLGKITNLEKELYSLKKEYEDKNKEYDRKIIEYDNQFDLSQIKKEMQEKGMIESEEIVMFEMGE